MDNKVDWAALSDDDDSEKGEKETTTTQDQNSNANGNDSNKEQKQNNKSKGKKRNPENNKEAKPPKLDANGQPIKNKGPKRNQPKEEMTEAINKTEDNESVYINIFDVEYSAKFDDIKALYPDVKIKSLTSPKEGIFIFELEKEQALELINIGPKQFNKRPFFMKLGYANKVQKKPDANWQNNNRNKHQKDIENGNQQQNGGEKKQNRNKRHRNTTNQPNRKTSGDENGVEEKDLNNKFFKGKSIEGGEFNIKFTRGASKKDDLNALNKKSSSETTNTKQDPFGGATPVDKPRPKESEFVAANDNNQGKEAPKKLIKQFEEFKKQVDENNSKGSTPTTTPPVRKNQSEVKLSASKMKKLSSYNYENDYDDSPQVNKSPRKKPEFQVVYEPKRQESGTKGNQSPRKGGGTKVVFEKKQGTNNKDKEKTPKEKKVIDEDGFISIIPEKAKTEEKTPTKEEENKNGDGVSKKAKKKAKKQEQESSEKKQGSQSFNPFSAFIKK